MKDFIYHLFYDNDFVQACIVVVLFGLVLFAGFWLIKAAQNGFSKEELSGQDYCRLTELENKVAELESKLEESRKFENYWYNKAQATQQRMINKFVVWYKANHYYNAATIKKLKKAMEEQL